MATLTEKQRSPVRGRGDLTSGGFTYPAKLVEGKQEVQEGSGDWRLRLVFERLDRQWDDGNPVRAYVSAFTTYHGDPVWAGSDADTIAESFENACGLDILDDDALADFIGHAFMLSDEDTGRTYTGKNGRERKAYLTTCIEYLGDETFKYAGRVTTVQGFGAEQAGQATEPDPATDPAIILATLLSGKDIEELKSGLALTMVKDCEELAEVKTVLGKPLRGGLVKPNAVLIDLLVENGYAADVDGVFTAYSE